MLGLFIFSTCKIAELDVRVILQNGRRGAEGRLNSAKEPMEVELRLFSEGRDPIVKSAFTSIPFDGFFEINRESLPEIYADEAEWMVLVRCRIGASDDYFPQEHQISFHNRRGRGYSPLLYDQLPMPAKKVPSEIILLAPKTWVGRHTSTFIIFVNSTGSLSTDIQASPMRILFFLPTGECVHEESRSLRVNGVWILDVREALGDRLPLSDEPLFLNVVAKGGSSMYAIMTVIRDDRTGHVAFEHSLSPHYYVSGNLGQIRKEALSFTAGGSH